MGEQINYVPYLPTEPPEGLTKWLLDRGKLSKEYLIYHQRRRYEPLEGRRVPAVRVCCSACGREMVAQKVDLGDCCARYAPAPFGWHNWGTGENVVSGEYTLCPHCGVEAEAVHTGRLGGYREMQQETYTAVVSRLEVPGHTPRLLLADWLTRRVIDDRGNTRILHHLYTAWVVEEKKLVRITGKTKYMRSVTLHQPEQRKTFTDDFDRAENIWPVDPAVLEGTTAENCKLDRYIRDGGEHLVGYLGLWRRRPQAENLVTAGLAKLLDGLIGEEVGGNAWGRRSGYARCESINWREVSPSKMLGLNRDQLAIFAGSMWETQEYAVIHWARENGVKIPEPWAGNVEQLANWYSWERDGVLKDGNGPRLWKILRYLERQGKEYNYLRDYWEVAGRLGMDLDNDQVRWPRNLKTAHDRAVERYNARMDAEVDGLIGGRAAALAWLSWERDGLLIRPCTSKAELRQEGKGLSHCVATYDRRYARGEDAILFIRRTDAPDEPYYTLELDEGHMTVLQNLGKYNCAPTDEVTAFVAAWLEWARREKMKKGGSAA